MDPELLMQAVQRARNEGVPPQEIDAALAQFSNGQFTTVAALERARTPQPAAPSALGTFLRSAAQGATFGLSDEIGGGIAGLLTPGMTPGEGIERSRERLEAGREEHPGLSLLGEVAGGAAVPLGYLKGVKDIAGVSPRVAAALPRALTGRAAPSTARVGETARNVREIAEAGGRLPRATETARMLGRGWAAGAVPGAAIGAVEGAARGEGVEDRALGGAIGGVMGGLLGGGISALGSALPTGRALGAHQRTLLETQGARVGNQVRRQVDVTPEGMATLGQNLRREAQDIYKTFDDAPIPIERVREVLSEEPLAEEAADAVLRRLRRPRTPGGGEDPVFRFQDYQSVRRSLADRAESLARAGESNAARDVRAARAALDEAVEEVFGSDDLRRANMLWRQSNAIGPAVEEGRKALSLVPTELRERFSALGSDAERDAFRAGLSRRLQERLVSSAGPPANNATLRSQLDLVFAENPAAVNEILGALEIENEFLRNAKIRETFTKAAGFIFGGTSLFGGVIPLM